MKDNVETILLRQLLSAYPWVETQISTNPEFGEMLLFLVDKIYQHARADFMVSLDRIVGEIKSDELPALKETDK